MKEKGEGGGKEGRRREENRDARKSRISRVYRRGEEKEMGKREGKEKGKTNS